MWGKKGRAQFRPVFVLFASVQTQRHAGQRAATWTPAVKLASSHVLLGRFGSNEIAAHVARGQLGPVYPLAVQTLQIPPVARASHAMLLWLLTGAQVTREVYVRSDPIRKRTVGVLFRAEFSAACCTLSQVPRKRPEQLKMAGLFLRVDRLASANRGRSLPSWGTWFWTIVLFDSEARVHHTSAKGGGRRGGM